MSVADIDINSLALKTELNQKVWGEDGHLHEEVRSKLLTIAEDFFEELGIPWAKLEDVRFTGSLANYNWSEYSDIDLHLVVDYLLVDENEDFVEAYFAARKNLWNNDHDITIHGFDIEVYVENSGEPHVSTGVYSVLLGEWIKKPVLEKPAIDKEAIRKKSKVLVRLIDDLVWKRFINKDYEGAIKSSERMHAKLKKMRQCGLDRDGEYSTENLTYKILRRNGYLDKLRDTKLDAYDALLTIGD